MKTYKSLIRLFALFFILLNLTVNAQQHPPCHANFDYTVSGQTVTFINLSSSLNTSVYEWHFGDGMSTTVNPTRTYPNNIGTRTVILVAFDTLNNCTDSINKRIDLSNPAGCNGDFAFSINGSTVDFTDVSPSSAISWYWDFGDGNIDSVQNPTHTYTMAGFYSVYLYINFNGCSQIINRHINIGGPTGALCFANFTSTQNNLTVDFINTSSSNATSWNWRFGDGTTSILKNPTHTYANYGNYSVRLITNNGSNCGDTIYKGVPLQNICDADFSYSKNYLSVNFTNTSSPNTNNWIWNFGDGNTTTVQNPTHTYSSAGSYTVQLTTYDSINQCNDIKTRTVIVNPVVCNANFSYTTNGLTATFANGSSSNTVVWEWDFGDGTSSNVQNPTHNYIYAGIYSVKLKAYDASNIGGTIVVNCIDSVTKLVNITYTPVACNAMFSVDSLNGLYASFDFVGVSNVYTNVEWDFGDGDSSYLPNPNHMYNTSGTYQVCLSVYSLDTNWNVVCTDTYCDSITVGGSGICNADFNFNTNNFTTSFNNTSLNTNSWYWNFGDGTTSSSQNPVHTYALAGTYSVLLQSYDSTTNCVDSILKVIIISGTPTGGCNANFTYAISGLNVNFTDSSSNASSWLWSFGDGTSSNAQNPNYTYTASGTYNVQLIISDSTCTDTVVKTITVTSPPVSCSADYNYNKNGLTVNFTDVSSGVNSWFWYFGDGAFSPSQNPTHTYPAAGTYTAVLIAYDNAGSCSDTISKTITVNPVVCIADYNFSVSNLTVSFNDLSSSNINARDWDFGDGTFSTSLVNPTHTYLSGGTYAVRLIAYDTNDGCSDTITKLVTVYNPAQCNAIFFALGGTSPSTVGIPITFFNASIGSSNASWTFGDGFSSNTYSPTHIYNSPGWYNVCLTITDSTCSDISCDSIYVDSGFTIQAVFSYTQIGNNHVAFTNGSTQKAYMSYYWDFGDGNTSTEMSPTHEYANGGNYTVCLIATDNITHISSMYCEDYVDPSASVGIVEDAEREIKVYPNPVSNMLTIEAEEVSNIKVYTTTGLMVLDTDATKIDMSMYSSGMYIVQIQFNDQSIATKRVVKTQ